MPRGGPLFSSNCEEVLDNWLKPDAGSKIAQLRLETAYSLGQISDILLTKQF